MLLRRTKSVKLLARSFCNKRQTYVQTKILLLLYLIEIKVDDFAVELEQIVSGVATDHYHSLPKKLRPKQRINTTEQWHIVKRSLDRLQVVQVFTPESLDLTLASLHRHTHIGVKLIEQSKFCP